MSNRFIGLVIITTLVVLTVCIVECKPTPPTPKAYNVEAIVKSNTPPIPTNEVPVPKGNKND